MRVSSIYIPIRSRPVLVVIERRRRYVNIRVDMWEACLAIPDIDSFILKLFEQLSNYSRNDMLSITVSRTVVYVENILTDHLADAITTIVRLLSEIVVDDRSCREVA